MRFGQFQIDLSTGELLRSGQPVHLQVQPFQILRLLLEAEGKVVTREQLCAALWPADTFVDFELGLNTAVKKLRQALQDPAEHSRFIETLPKRGYRFMAPFEWLTETTHKDHDALHLVVAIGRAETELPESTGVAHLNQSRIRAWKIGAMSLLAGLLVVAVTACWAFYRWRSRASQTLNRDAMVIQKLADTSYVDDIAISPDGRYVVYARKVGEKSSLRMRQLESGGDVEVLPPDDTDFVGLTFSPDGSYLYFVRSEKEDHGLKHLYVMPALGGPSRKVMADVDSPVSFSPDGRQFVFTRGFPMKNEVEIRIASPDGSGEHLLTTMVGSGAGFQPGATWSPDGRTIAVPVFHRDGKPRSTLYAISVSEGSQREIYSNDGVVGRPVWLPDGRGMLATLFERGETRGQLWTISFPLGKTERVSNDLSDYSTFLDMTPDGKSAVTAGFNAASNIWAASAADNSRLEQITSGDIPMFEAIEMKNGKLLVAGGGEIWIMNADGTARSSFAKLGAYQISTCGAFVIAGGWEHQEQRIVRLDADGSHVINLAKRSVSSPACSPDGKFVFYAGRTPTQRILRVPIEGGTPIEITQIPGDGIMSTVEISNDGQYLAFKWEQYKPVPGMHLSIISAGDGSVVKSFVVPSELKCLRWSADDTALQYVLTHDAVDNLWQQPLSGEPPRQLTKFTSGLIFNFSRAKADGRLLIARGSLTNDGVLLTHLR